MERKISTTKIKENYIQLLVCKSVVYIIHNISGHYEN